MRQFGAVPRFGPVASHTITADGRLYSNLPAGGSIVAAGGWCAPSDSYLFRTNPYYIGVETPMTDEQVLAIEHRKKCPFVYSTYGEVSPAAETCNCKFPRKRVTFTQVIRARERVRDARALKEQRRLEVALEGCRAAQTPKEPLDGSVVRFQITFARSGRTYSYVATRVGTKWFVTGNNTLFPAAGTSWTELVRLARTAHNGTTPVSFKRHAGHWVAL